MKKKTAATKKEGEVGRYKKARKWKKNYRKGQETQGEKGRRREEKSRRLGKLKEIVQQEIEGKNDRVERKTTLGKRKHEQQIKQQEGREGKRERQTRTKR